MRRLAAASVAVIVVLTAVIIGFGELSGEVVTLRTIDATGKAHTTRLWIVEGPAALWLRAGARAVDSPDSWYARLRSNPIVELDRSGHRSTFRAIPSPDARADINARMREAYGLPDRIIGAFRDPNSSVPVRLDPVEAP